MEEPKRMKWKGKCDFILSLIGYGVGLGNIWRFPYLCAQNGGAVFLIPYAVFMVLLAFPLTFLELSLGQFSGKSAIGVWDICPAMRGAGYSMTGLSLICSLYYNTILAWILYYLVHSFMSPLPWATCNNWWNTDRCYMKHITTGNATNITPGMNDTSFTLPFNVTNFNGFPTNYFFNSTNSSEPSYTPSEEFWNLNLLRISDGFEDAGTIQWHLVAVLGIAWFILYVCLFKGVESVGKVVYVTATLPYILLTIIIIKALTLPGAMKGVEFYIIPDFNKLADVQVWLQAMMQMFFSVGMGWGGFIVMSSYNDFNNNILRDTILYCVLGEGTSFYAGFAVFPVLGYMAHITGSSVKDLVRTGPGLAFISYPEALAQLPIPQLWSVLFFVMLLTTAVDSMFVNVEVYVTTVADALKIFTWKKRSILTAISCCIMFLSSLMFATQAGIYIFQLIDWYVSAVTVLVVTVLECIVIGWIYGADRYFNDIELMLGKRPTILFKILWKFATPTLLLVVLPVTLTQYPLPTYGDYKYPPIASVFGWIIALITAVPIPVWFVKEVYNQKGSMLQRVKSSFKPNINWEPMNNKYVEAVTDTPL